jgi:deazaflavin-dependent oxidoreductase (nitroreductase family)
MPGQQPAQAPDFNQRVISEFRANDGRVGGMFQGRPLILITTEGRRSGRPRTNPVAYLRDGSRYIVFGSNQGRPQHPGWYHNVLASPQVTMEIGDGGGHLETLSARAVVLQGAERDRLYQLQCTISPAFGRYRDMTTRVIPVVALYPLDLSEHTERTQLIGQQLAAHHDSLRARLRDVRARIEEVLAAGPAHHDAGLPAGDLVAEPRQHCLSYCYGLGLHHIREEGAFSAIERQFPHLIPIIDRLRSEHRTLAQALATLETRLTSDAFTDPIEIRAALDEAVAGLDEHFAFEEEQLIAATRRTPTTP